MKTNKMMGWMAALVMAVVLCIPATVFAESGAPVVPLDTDEETMFSIAEELKDVLILKASHTDIYSNDEEIAAIGQQAVNWFSAGEPYRRILEIPADNLMNSFISEEFTEIPDLSDEELLQLFERHFGNTIVSSINASVSVSYVAASSIIRTSRSYVADLEQETMVIFEYAGPVSLAVDFYPSGEHVMTADATLIYTEFIPHIYELCYPDMEMPENPGTAGISKGILKFILDDTVVLDGTNIQSAELVPEITGNYLVSLQFDEEGAEILESVTSQNIGKTMDIVLMDEVLFSPVIQSAIQGGSLIIMMDDQEMAEELVAFLNGELQF